MIIILNVIGLLELNIDHSIIVMVNNITKIIVI